MFNDDLMRSYNQYIKQQELGYLKINFLNKIILSILFFILIPLAILTFFNVKNNSNKLVIFSFCNKEPMKSILDKFRLFDSDIVILEPKAVAVFPFLLIKDFYQAVITNPLWVVKNLDFFGALSLKISKYYGYKVKYGIGKLLVFQEYSFYSSYLTRIFEAEQGSVYNLMHGIPGDEASFFRFTKCFVWGKYFKDFYININAEVTQFIVAGSIFHYYIKDNFSENYDIDILYAMQGDTEELQDVLDVLEVIAKSKRVRYLQHPRYRVNMENSKLVETKDNCTNAIAGSNIIISHFSTTLLDAMVLRKNVISYLYNDSIQNKYILYMNRNSIVHTKENLISLLNEKTLCNDNNYVDEKYINMSKNPVEIIMNEIFKTNFSIE